MSVGTRLLQIHDLNAESQPLENILLEGQAEGKEQETEEPKKRKGGWPKGKKRKPPKEFEAPRAPTTGYVIFLNEQRIKLKAEYPDLPFTEITKMLATQWSQLSQEKKQTYISEAEKDKQRYIEELKAYQSSEAYQAFLKRRAVNKVKTLCGIESLDAELENEAAALSEMDGDENNDLYCRTCKQYFSSLHNKKEHLLGKQHLQNLTGEFEKETAELSKQQEVQEEEELDLGEEESDEEADKGELAQLCELNSDHHFVSLDLSFLQEFIFKQLKLREFEVSELKRSFEKAQEDHENFSKQLEDYKNQKLRLEADLANLKAYGGTLEAQLENLKMVPMLFQFHIQIMDNDVPVDL
ncbi:SWI/SNF-related matrix-associated actin-dependent regulator of chromatin subfamily E member 1-related isoform X2 [Latimeria chalumnae]|uniref:HMG box domain-containing protein n=1 Tax=Latimeria chalumnae TaxID=7897 RepID=H3AR83_LATCH|nr:PREDICTED: SWI/SNF-related matrix-associated actin-dependent regulator of chromatin subfamily E member 1-related-like isoform X2 [Latimeria chalumnae]|eukprot:XP_005999901.1 PREDICTED: SWI/SNF-related matrix-associated actin-dependent regulator of chromatin subfamily E member 1-related-like isoform X2 [Latimeria chalumnae]